MNNKFYIPIFKFTGYDRWRVGDAVFCIEEATEYLERRDISEGYIKIIDMTNENKLHTYKKTTSSISVSG